jgi:CheY-like chemotaxis protein
MDGFQFLAALRQNENCRGIPVIVFTAKDITAEDRERLRGSIRGILHKAEATGVRLAREIAELMRGRQREGPPQNSGGETQNGAADR